MIVCYISIILFTLSHSDIRTSFHNELNSEEKLNDLLLCQPIENDSITTLAYHGLIKTMLAEYEFWPMGKLRSFTEGKQSIEFAILLAPDNLELRYIRLLVQLNAPSFLGYYKNVTNDLNYIKDHFMGWNLKSEWGEVFIKRLLESKKLETHQIHTLESLIMQLH